MKFTSDLSIFESESNHRRAIAILANETIRDLRCPRSIAFKWAWSRYREFLAIKSAQEAEISARAEAERQAFFLARRDALRESKERERFTALRGKAGHLSRAGQKALRAVTTEGGALAYRECAVINRTNRVALQFAGQNPPLRTRGTQP